MNQYQFWGIIEKANKESHGDDRVLIDLVEKQLEQLTRQEIRLFDAIYFELYCRSYQKRLWRALGRIYSFVSDDGFDDFRDWLISRGEGIFCEVIKNPERVCEFLPEDKKHCPGLEYLHYVTKDVCEEKGIEYPCAVDAPYLVGYDWLQKDRIQKGDV